MSTTIKEVIEKHRSVVLTTQLFGQAMSYASEYATRLRNLGGAICREQGVAVEKGFDLPLTTVLGESSLGQYRKLNAWLAEQPPLN